MSQKKQPFIRGFDSLVHLIKPRTLYPHRNIIFLLLFGILGLILPQASNAQYLVGGSASTLSGGCYQLTSAINSQAGYVYRQQAINLNDPFDFRFRVYLGTNNGGADGIVFVLRGSLGTPYIGTGGGGLGYNGSGFSDNSIGIEVDTWYNGNYNDIAADHIGIQRDGTVNHTGANALAGPIQASATTANVEDGNYHTFNVRWDPSAQELEVYLDCDYRLQYSGNLIDSIFGGDSTVFWGFLGTTGGANNVQRFCLTNPIDSLVTDLEDVTICDGDSVQLDAGAGAVDYSWSPATGLSSTSASAPFASPNATTTYYVEESYLCDTLMDTVTVNVLAAPFNISSVISNALCKDSCDGEIDITVSNGSGMYDFTWSNTDSTEDVTGLCAGTYTVTVQDVDTNSTTYLCTKIETFSVDEPDYLVAGIINPSKTSCADGSTCDASATATASGGTFPYNYLWTSGEVNSTATQLCADSNWVTVTDANGCASEEFVVIQIPDSIQTTAYGDTMICLSNLASIIAASTGGTSPFSYVWRRDALDGTVIATSQWTNVSPDSTTQYFVASVDANGCPGDTSHVEVRVRPPLGSEILDVDTICPYDTTTLTVSGTGGDSIYTYAWQTGQFGQSVDVSPDLPRWYNVTVSDACGSPSYVDSVFVQVGGYSPIDVTIRVEDDSLCAGEVTHLIVSGRGGFRGPDEYQFKWLHNGETNNILFVRPDQTRTFTAQISDLCLSEPGTASATIYVGKPEPALIQVAPKEACAETDVTVSISNYNDNHDYTWFMGDSSSYSQLQTDSITHRYKATGCYDIRIASITEFGCHATAKEVCAVRILSQPVAAFKVSPPQPTNKDEIITIVNEALGSTQHIWYIGADTLYDDQHIQRQFEEWTSPDTILQVVRSSDGCVDSMQYIISYVKETLIYYPSAFTPNEDDRNDRFAVVGEMISSDGFELKIYDRWGHLVYLSTSPDLGWDGMMPDGDRAPQGVYPITIRYQDHQGESYFLSDRIFIPSAGKNIPLR